MSHTHAHARTVVRAGTSMYDSSGLAVMKRSKATYVSADSVMFCKPALYCTYTDPDSTAVTGMDSVVRGELVTARLVPSK